MSIRGQDILPIQYRFMTTPAISHYSVNLRNIIFAYYNIIEFGIKGKNWQTSKTVCLSMIASLTCRMPVMHDRRKKILSVKHRFVGMPAVNCNFYQSPPHRLYMLLWHSVTLSVQWLQCLGLSTKINHVRENL